MEGPIFLADHWSTRQQAKEIPFKISAQALLHIVIGEIKLPG